MVWLRVVVLGISENVEPSKMGVCMGMKNS